MTSVCMLSPVVDPKEDVEEDDHEDEKEHNHDTHCYYSKVHGIAEYKSYEFIVDKLCQRQSDISTLESFEEG